MDSSKQFDVGRYLNVFYKFKWYGLIPAVVVMAILAIGASFLPDIYQSTCIVEVESGSIVNPLKSRRDRRTSFGEHLREFSETAMSWDILSRVGDTVGAENVLDTSDIYNINKIMNKLGIGNEPDPASPEEHDNTEAIVAALRSGINVRAKPPRFLVLTFNGTQSKVNAEILNALATTLVEERELSALNDAGRSLEFLQSEVENYRLKLEEAETQLKEFKEEHVSELPNNMNVNLNQLATDKADLLARELEMHELTTRVAYIDEELEKQSELVISEIRSETNPMLTVLNERIVDMEIELTRLRTNYTELHPRVAELRGQLEDLKRQRDEVYSAKVDSETSMLNPVYQQLMQDRQDTMVRLEVLKSRITNLKKRIAENEETVRGMPAQEQELLRLTRNYEVNADIYNMFLQELEEAKIQEKLATDESDRQSYQIVQFARAHLTPIGPKKLMILLVILGAGVGMGAGIIFLLDFFDDSFNSVEEAKEFIAKPLLGTIPLLNGQNGDGVSPIRRMITKGADKVRG